MLVVSPRTDNKERERGIIEFYSDGCRCFGRPGLQKVLLLLELRSCWSSPRFVSNQRVGERATAAEAETPPFFHSVLKGAKLMLLVGR